MTSIKDYYFFLYTFDIKLIEMSRKPHVVLCGTDTKKSAILGVCQQIIWTITMGGKQAIEIMNSLRTYVIDVFTKSIGHDYFANSVSNVYITPCMWNGIFKAIFHPIVNLQDH